MAWLGYAIWVLLAIRIRRPVCITLGAALGCIYLWAITNLPLARVYALGVGTDRLNNMAMCTPVAAGSPFFETHQVGQKNFEPFWSLLVALVSGFNPGRVITLYPYFSLAVVLLFVWSLYAGLRLLADPWGRAFAVFFAVMLSTTAGDLFAPHRSVWTSFLLKPNHNLALVLVPLLLSFMARMEGWPARLAAGLLLHLIGWAFVLHWVYVSAGLVVYAGLTAIQNRSELRKVLLDVAATIGFNLLVVSPYLYLLFTGYPFMLPQDAHVIPSVSGHFARVTLDQGVLFPLSLWGGLLLYRRSDRLSRLWVSLAIAALALWIGYIGLSWARMAKESDELYYFLRMVSAVLAGLGAWDIAGRVAARLRLTAVPAALLLLCFPLALPNWWNPAEMDPYFQGSRAPLPEGLVRTMTFVRDNTAPDEAFIAGRLWGRYVPALGARRLLNDFFIHVPPEAEERGKLRNAVLRRGDPEAAKELERRFGVRYVLADPDLLETSGVTLEEVRSNPLLVKLYEAGDEAGDFWIVFRLEPGG